MPRTAKLRCKAISPAFSIVLVEPEIPPNTGAVARTCAATQTPLHLVGRLGFDVDARAVRRAGIDYWHLVDVHQHSSFAAYRDARPDARVHLFSSAAQASYLNADMTPGDALVFGKESVGLPRELLDQYPDRVWGIPTSGNVRSLNLSNAVAIVLFEALRRCDGLMDTFVQQAVQT